MESDLDLFIEDEQNIGIAGKIRLRLSDPQCPPA
jgi:hypothetical protein